MRTPSSAPRLWIAAVSGILILAAVAAYYAGGAVEHSASAKEVAAAEGKYAAAQTQLASARSTNALLTANLWAYRAAAALDERNFGLANDAVADVVASLKGVDAGAANVDGAALSAAGVEAANTRIAVATDLQAQRGQLLRLASDIGALTARTPAQTK